MLLPSVLKGEHVGRWVAFLAFVCVLAAPATGQEDRPLKTEGPELIGVGSVRVDFGVEFLHRQRYPLSGLEGDLMRLGVTTIRIGVGDYAEFQISGVCRDFLTVNRRTAPAIAPTFAGDTSSDFGDLLLGTKLKLAAEKGTRPAIAFKFAVHIATATNESGLGTDETEFFSSLLISKHLGKVQLLGDLGLAILGSPIQPNSQADLLTYGLGVIVPVSGKLELVGEMYGRQGPLRLGNESLSQAQMGARFRAAGLHWEVAGVAGLKHFNPSYGLTIGVTFEFQAFHKKRSPVTIKQEKPPDGVKK